ncbi:hypothetical protein GCM10022236_42230 [Microlunatus ginsengisoli]|uniref:Uncharacterized protein n=2 Tax=Microlunatus ginsengisoli TaxID=363863 RepID=A0ABP7AM33_9ACTN
MDVEAGTRDEPEPARTSSRLQPASPHRGSDNLRRAPSSEQLTAAADRAREGRARFLLAVLDGSQSLAEVPWTACAGDDRRLLRVRLRQLVTTAPLWDARRSNAALGHVAMLAGAAFAEVRDAQLAWLVDPRSSGRRILAWLDAFRPRSRPWHGFPFAPVPDTFPAEGPGRPPVLAARTVDGELRDRR